MMVTIAALAVMPILATLKRREARRTNNVALAADAVQSATCAYLALITLAGLAANAVFHIPWVDSVAALLAIPILLKEGRMAICIAVYQALPQKDASAMAGTHLRCAADR